jgi:hypothetical protein
VSEEDDPSVRSGSHKRLAALSVAGVALGGLLGAWGAFAATTTRTVPLKLTIFGAATARLSGPVTGKHSFTCRRLHDCVHTFKTLEGRRVVIRILPRTAWKLDKWGDACEGVVGATCSVRPTRRAGRQVKVDLLQPGDPHNPIKLGTAWGIAGGWRLKVNSAIINADTEVEAVTDPHSGLPANPTPPAGDQYLLVNVSMTNVSSSAQDLQVLNVIGVDDDQAYLPCTPPPPDLSSVTQVLSQQTVTGNVCFVITSYNYKPPYPLLDAGLYFALQ